jgi:putative ABC transport system permease protein
MSLWRQLTRGICKLTDRNSSDQEINEEMQHFLDEYTAEFAARGFSSEEARRAAKIKMGNMTSVKEQVRSYGWENIVDTLFADLRYGARQLRRNPGFTAITVLTLALGIGANTAVFSVVNSVLLKPLAYPKSEELVALHQKAPGAAGLFSVSDGLPLSASMYVTYSDHNRSFQSLGAWTSGTANVTGQAEAEQVRTVNVTDGVLQTLAVPPVLGRALSSSDQQPGSSTTVMLSYGYWQRHFGADRSILGRKINVDGKLREIIGVMPRGFQLVNADFDLIVPLAIDRGGKLRLAGFEYHGIARLKPGATIAEANADITRMLQVWMDSWSNGPGINSHFYDVWRITPALRPLKQQVVGEVGNVLWVVMATLGIVMLITCANVANLLLVRTEARQQELAIRAALGAGWWRIVRALLVESVVLGIFGGVLAVGLAYAGLKFLIALGPNSLPRLAGISLDTRSLIFTLILSLLSALLFGLIPAFKYAGTRISLVIRSAGRTASSSRERHGARNMLVVTQVALALILLVSAGLMIRTFQTLRTVDPGFTHAEHLQIMRISIPPALVAQAQQVTRIQNTISDKLAAIPGVTSVGFASEMPMEGLEPGWDIIIPEGRPDATEENQPLRMFKYVSPGFVQTDGTKLVAGRDLTWTDVYEKRPSVLVSENLAREVWGTPSAALGKRFTEFGDRREIVGVVEDVRENGVSEKAPSIVYWPPMTQRSVTYVVRSDRTGTASFLNEIRQAVSSVNSELPLTSVRTMQELYDHSLARTSFALVMLVIAGSMALAIGIIGIYGVISYTVSQRTRKIGIRLALGAQQGAVTRMFVRHALLLAGIGAAIGLAGAIELMQLMKSLLFGISPRDPLTYIVVSAVLITVAALASYLPARRAAAVDPANTLRAD